MSKNLSYCGQVVRDHDPDRFLLSMFAPADRREALWALFAFNHEIAKTRESVTETQLGLIRLQWWRDGVASIYEGEAVPEHVALLALAEAIKAYDLPQEHFNALIYAREFDLEDVRPSTMEGVLHYADFTTTPLLKLAVQICGDDPEAEPVTPIAVNYALAGLLRAAAAHAAQRRCYLPEDLMNEGGLMLNKLYDFKPQEGLLKVVEAVAGEFVGDVKSDTAFLKASQALARIYICQIKGLGFDIFHAKMRVEPAFKAFRLLVSVRFV